MNKVNYNFYRLCIFFILRVLYVCVCVWKFLLHLIKQFPPSELVDVYLMTLFHDKMKVIRRVLIHEIFRYAELKLINNELCNSSLTPVQLFSHNAYELSRGRAPRDR